MGRPVESEQLTEHVTTRLLPSESRELEQQARREDRSVASIVRRSVRYYLDHKRKGLI